MRAPIISIYGDNTFLVINVIKFLKGISVLENISKVFMEILNFISVGFKIFEG